MTAQPATALKPNGKPTRNAMRPPPIRAALPALAKLFAEAAITWGLAVLVSLGLLLRDLKLANPEIGGLMRVVWLLTVLYSGPLGLALYWWSGRKQIPRDSPWRRGACSVAHYCSDCGAGEVVGLLITVGLLAWKEGALRAVAHIWRRADAPTAPLPAENGNMIASLRKYHPSGYQPMAEACRVRCVSNDRNYREKRSNPPSFSANT